MDTRLYQPKPTPLEVALASLTYLPDFTLWHNKLLSQPEKFERICLDRYLLILGSLLRYNLLGCTLLDLGSSAGFFSYNFALTVASKVTAVEDQRGLEFGYSEDAFSKTLKDAINLYQLKNVELINQSVETFLADNQASKSWDVVLCLSVLHHFQTGYGDNPNIGKLEEDEKLDIFNRIGKVTNRFLYLEIDDDRIGDEVAFFTTLCDAGNFCNPVALGRSCSAPGKPRTVWEIRKKP